MADKKNDILNRGYLVFAGFIIFGLSIIGRVGYLQFVQGEYWKSKADSLMLRYHSIEPMRGNVYAADGSLLATSVPRYDVHIDLMASGITDEVFREQVDSLAHGLSMLFGDKSRQDYKRLLKQARSSSDRRYFLLKRNISYKQQRALKTFPIFRMGKNKGGLIIDQRSRREKPFRLLAARTIGFKVENNKVESVGIEGAFDPELRGTTGQRLMQRIAGGIWKPVNSENEIDPMDGFDVITTIDVNLQDVAENALLRQLEMRKAGSGCAVLMEVSTGHIKAIANLSRSDEDSSYQEDYNYAVGHGTEPGSTFKLATLMAAIEDGFVNPDDTTDTSGGVITLAGGKRIEDSHKGGYGRIPVKKAFAVSSNVGIIRVVQQYYKKNPQQFIDRLRSLHIADPLELQIPGAGQPMLRNTTDSKWSKLSLPYISIGYESVLTPLQLLTFYNAVANNGRMVQPLLVKEIRNKGHLVKSFPVKVIADSICSSSTILKARTMLEEVVKSGTASHIKHAQYSIAGKTGTAQIAQGSKGYKKIKREYQASFCGYFPADNPKYSCIVVVYSPGTDVFYGASVACPVFKEIADKAYALDIDMHKELSPAPDSIFAGLPPLKAGRAQSAQRISRVLRLGYELPGNGWLSTSSRPFNPEISKVPDVTGMGLRDAVYLLEQQGLQVKPVGRGSVIRQSLPPGSKTEKGRQIVIELS